MKLEYQNGVRITKLVHEMTPLEVAINRYEELAKKHYAKAGTGLETERKAELDESLKHLDLERERLGAISDVQAGLEKYREAGLKVKSGNRTESINALTMMTAEKHHPTAILEKYMRAEGKPKLSSKHTAHHIVPGKGLLEQLTGRTRLHLHKHGIRINDPANGVYLVAVDRDTPHWSMPNSRGHKKYHTKDYERWVFQKVTSQDNIDFIKTQLQVIGRILQDNEPKAAIPSSRA